MPLRVQAMAEGTIDRSRPAPAGRPNDVLTDRTGKVYRRNASGQWQQRQGGTVDTGPGPRPESALG